MTTHKQWLAERRTGIGGSDSAAVLGLSPYKSPVDVWLDKTGQSDETPDNTAMQWGRLLEATIRQNYAETTGRIVDVPREILRAKTVPHILANVDGLTNDGRVLEVKTARSDKEWGEAGTDQIPRHYLLQVQHYMLVTERPVADVAVLIGGQDYRVYTVNADAELHRLMAAHYAAFWRKVEERTPPEPVSYADVQAIYGRTSRNVSVEATPEIAEALSKLRDRRIIHHSYEEEIEHLQAIIMKHMGEADTLTIGGREVVTWRTSKPPITLDKKKLREEHPDIYAAFTRLGNPSRRFLIKGE